MAQEQPKIAWVCISDLHLGAPSSLLTEVDERGRTAPDRTSSVSLALADALRSLVGDQQPRPRLVLLGDALELALTTTDRTLVALEHFLRALRGADPVVASEIWYVPGNHDHHIWQVGREEMYARALVARPDAPIGRPWHVSAMFAPDADEESVPLLGGPTTPGVLQAVAERVGDTSIDVVYPNLALRGPDGRVVVMHHGHFTESIYTLMTSLREAIFGHAGDDAASSRRFWQLEEDNGAWIDFVWSGLGRSGAAGTAVGTGFEMVGDPSAGAALADRVAAVAVAAAAQRGSWWTGAAARLAEPAGQAALRAVVGRAGHRSRFHVGGPFSDRIRAGVERYVSGPVHAQYLDECAHESGAADAELTFVFGHTHKPFATTVPIDAWHRPVRVVNTGGWVVDGVEAHPMNGGAVVVLDDQLHVAALRVSSQSDNPANQRVSVDAPESDRTANPLWRWLHGRIDASEDPWRALVEANRREVLRRRTQLRERLTTAVESLGRD